VAEGQRPFLHVGDIIKRIDSKNEYRVVKVSREKTTMVLHKEFDPAAAARTGLHWYNDTVVQEMSLFYRVIYRRPRGLDLPDGI
jgi:hypothetical protein